MTRRSKILSIVTVLVMILIISFWLFIRHMFASFKMPAFPPAVVTTVKTEISSWPENIEAVGTLNAMQGITLKTEVSGRVTNISFKSGEKVVKGTTLMQLNPDILQAQLQSQLAELSLDKINLERDQKLFNKGVKSQAELDTSESTYKAELAQANSSKAQLAQTTVKAPFSGTLGLRQVSLGDYLTAGASVVNLQDLDHMRVDFSIPDIYLGQLQNGLSITATSKAYPSKKFKGQVYAYESLVNQNNQTIAIRAKIENPQHSLIPGTFVEVKLQLPLKQTVIALPQTAVLYSVAGNYVYTINKKNEAVQQFVTLGPRIGSQIAVIKGLQPGQTVITTGQIKVQNGSKVITEDEMQQKLATAKHSSSSMKQHKG